jgi:hypothetical protein
MASMESYLPTDRIPLKIVQELFGRYLREHEPPADLSATGELFSVFPQKNGLLRFAYGAHRLGFDDVGITLVSKATALLAAYLLHGIVDIDLDAAAVAKHHDRA